MTLGVHLNDKGTKAMNAIIYEYKIRNTLHDLEIICKLVIYLWS